MTAKKSPEADLEKKRFAFLQIGLVLSCAICLLAFEYSTLKTNQQAKNTEVDKDTVLVFYTPEEEIIPIQTPKKAVFRTQIIDDINEVKHEVKVSDFKTDKKIKVKDVTFCDDCGEEEEIKKTVPPYDSLFIDPGKYPEFPGGLTEMGKFINRHYYNYLPEYAEKMSGTIYVRFVVDKDGTIKNIKLLRGIHSDYDNAAIAVVNKMPRWIPGEHYGKPVKVQMDLPIKIAKSY